MSESTSTSAAIAPASAELALDDLANQFGSDKGTRCKRAHGYTIVYELLLHAYRHRPINLLEMGLCRAGEPRGGNVDRHITNLPSVEMWKAYFPLATVYGFDIRDYSRFEDERFRFVQGDSGSSEDVRRLSALGVLFDVIIDDASHASYHQLLAFSILFGALKPGGLYIIEDLHWQPRPFERTLPATATMASILHHIGSGAAPLPTLPVDIGAAVRNIYSITTYDWKSLDRLKRFRRIHDGVGVKSLPSWRRQRWFRHRLLRWRAPMKLAVLQKMCA